MAEVRLDRDRMAEGDGKQASPAAADPFVADAGRLAGPAAASQKIFW
jgi:hypothetical protein